MGQMFVIQEHKADRAGLHHDFRLECDGVLISWAIPKLVPPQFNVKRLAIRVEDHDLSYANFQGEISEGYGKGTVSIFDRGYYDAIKMSATVILIELHGAILQGRYRLIRMKDMRWLIWKAYSRQNGPERGE